MKCFWMFHDWSLWYTDKVTKTIWYDPYFGTYEKTIYNYYLKRQCLRCGKFQEKKEERERSER